MTSIILPSEISPYFENNSALFVQIVKSFDVSKLNNPVIISFLCYVAQCTDTKYNIANGGKPIFYENNSWQDDFTDDFWTVLLLFYNYPTDASRYVINSFDNVKELIHLGWFFGKLATISPSEIKPFVESNAVYTINYGDETWCNTTIRDRLNQLQPFNLIGSEQQKDNIPFISFNMAFINNKFDYDEIRNIFIESFPITDEIRNQFVL